MLIFYKKFMLFIAVQTFSMGAMFAYIAGSSFIFQEFYGISAMAYSFCFAINGAGLVIGARCASFLQDAKALKTGVLGLFTASILVACALNFRAPVFIVAACFFIMLLFTGFILPTASALAMNCGRKRAGSASAILGFCPFFLGGVVSPLAGLGDIFCSTSLAIFICAALALTAFFTAKRLKFIKRLSS